MYYVSMISSNEYAPHAGALIYSIFKNNKELDIEYFVLGNYKPDTIEKFLQLEQQINGKINLISIDEEELKNYPTGNWWGVITYCRLFLDKLLPDYIDKVINYDVDIICNGSLKEVFETDLDGYVYAGCEDMALPLNAVDNKDRLGLDQSDAYVNGGFYFFNLKYWRENNMGDVFIGYLNKNIDNIKCLEQDIFNATCKGMIKRLHLKYNSLSGYFYESPMIKDEFKDQLFDCIHNPVILHFTDAVKPWNTLNLHPYKYLYRECLASTPWKGLKFKPRAKRPILHTVNMYLQFLLHYSGLRKNERFFIRLKK